MDGAWTESNACALFLRGGTQVVAELMGALFKGAAVELGARRRLRAAVRELVTEAQAASQHVPPGHTPFSWGDDGTTATVLASSSPSRLPSRCPCGHTPYSWGSNTGRTAESRRSNRGNTLSPWHDAAAFRVDAQPSSVVGGGLGLFVRRGNGSSGGSEANAFEEGGGGCGGCGPGVFAALYAGEWRPPSVAAPWWESLVPGHQAIDYTASLLDGSSLDGSGPAASAVARAALDVVAAAATGSRVGGGDGDGDSLSTATLAPSPSPYLSASQWWGGNVGRAEGSFLASVWSLGALVNHAPHGTLPNAAFYELPASWLLDKDDIGSSDDSDGDDAEGCDKNCVRRLPVALRGARFLRALPLRTAATEGPKQSNCGGGGGGDDDGEQQLRPARVLAIVTLRRLRPGEELFVDYGFSGGGGGYLAPWFRLPWADCFGASGRGADKAWSIPVDHGGEHAGKGHFGGRDEDDRECKRDGGHGGGMGRSLSFAHFSRVALSKARR